ncbi:MAG: hypothetical protein Q8O89_01260, partial [Nanoarchaeota archaeon]|nr:hypothetical protein [Nanoarchaeota archaeon]
MNQINTQKAQESEESKKSNAGSKEFNEICSADTFQNLLKADLHMHSGEDKLDRVPYSAKTFIDKLHDNKFDVISFSFHDQAFY